MNRHLLIIAAFVLAASPLAHAGDLLSPVAAERLGMVESWHRQFGIIGGASSVVDLQVWTQRNKNREFVEVVLADRDGNALADGEVLRRIATDMKHTSGLEIGKTEAERMARLDVLKLKRRGVQAAIRALSVKQVRLYLLGSDGGLAAYDAETGESLWSIRIGDPRLGYGTLGISDSYVTVINGTTMYRIIADERKLDNSIAPGGRPIKPVRLDSIPVIGAVNTQSYVVVPNTRSGLECYTYEPEPGEPSFEMFAGQALAKPTRFPTSAQIGWTTDRGFFYLMETDGKPSTSFRLQIDGNAHGGATAASGGRFFFASSAGRVYGILGSRLGEVIWNRSFGEPFYQAPFVTQEHVLLASTYGNLYSLSAKDGSPQWAAPATGIDSVFANTGDYYFGRTTSGLLTIVVPKTGQQIAVAGNVFVDRIVVNPETDRVYLVSDGGMVQCLRPAASELPVFYRDLAEPAAEPETAPTKPKQPESSNPFGAAEPATPATDPFGPSDPGKDPFGGADPFGGGADPFGGGGDDPFK